MTTLAQVTAREQGDVLHLDVVGEIDLSNSGELLRRILAAVPNEARAVIVDLSRVTYVDSAAIAMVFRLGERLLYRRQSLTLVVPPSAPIHRVLELTKVHQVIPIVDTPEGAAGP